MKYKHTDFDNSINSPTESRLLELAKYLGGFVVLIAILYFILGLIANALVPYISPKAERELWGESINLALAKNMGDEVKEMPKLQLLLDSLPKNDLPDYGGYKIFIMSSKEPNAFAAAGGYIFVTTGLLEELKTENALVFILGHELGHFKNRDQLRGMGRGLVLALVQLLFLGQDTSILGGSTTGIELALSRQQEEDADKIGLDILIRKYGHCAGAFEFFEKMDEKYKSSRYMKYFSSHPHDKDRIETLKNIMIEKNCNSLQPKQLAL